MTEKPQADSSGRPEIPAEPGPPSLRARLLALLFYLGAGPFFWRWRRRHPAGFLAHHYDQAMGITLLLFLVAAFFVTIVLIDSWVMIHHRGFFEAWHFEPRVLDIAWKLFLCWLVFEVFAMGLALLGSSSDMLLVGWLVRRRCTVAAGAFLPAAVYILLLALVPVTLHASSLVRSDARPGTVYLLYEDLDQYPRWLFALGFYRMARVSRDTLGPEEVVMLRLTEDAIARAKAEARFVFIGSHGMAKGMLLSSGYVKPDAVAAMPGTPHLEYVYMTSCDSGARREAWEAAFAPAEVVTHERLTALIEHIWWMWFTGPQRIRERFGQ
jgi:sarcosine oxidase delta subunit